MPLHRGPDVSSARGERRAPLYYMLQCDEWRVQSTSACLAAWLYITATNVRGWRRRHLVFGRRVAVAGAVCDRSVVGDGEN